MKLLRTHRLDAALVALAVVVLVTSLGESLEHVRFASAIFALALVLLVGRAWRPPATSLLGFALLAAGGHVSPQISGTMFVSILVCFAVAGTLSSRIAALVAWVAGCAAMLATMVGNPYVEGASDIALTLTFCTIIWGAGLLAAERGRAAGAAHARADLVESHRDLDVAEATAHERDRIAGELHDIVSHGLSIVILQTVAARMALADGGTEQPAVERRLGAVESTAREALDDMRRLLDLLRPNVDGDVPADTTMPSVGLGQLPALVEQARAAGLPLEAEVATAGPDLPAGLDAAAYRIVQEALTNVLKHAPGSKTQVTVRRGDTCLEVAVSNAAGLAPEHAPRGAGYGLIGMRQRAALYGGRFEAGSAPEGYRVSAVFPLGETGVISVLIADDQALVRDGFRAIIDREPDLEVVGEAADGVEAIEMCRRLHPDVVLMDIRMPLVDGLEATRQVMGLSRSPRVLVLTTFDRNDWVYEALKAGAGGFLLKDVRGSQLTDAIRTVAAGEALLAPAITGRFIEDYLGRHAAEVIPDDVDLSERECEVLRKIALGRSNAEIADELFLGVSTVKTYVNRLLTKLDLRDRTQAAVYAYEQGIVRPGHSRGA